MSRFPTRPSHPRKIRSLVSITCTGSARGWHSFDVYSFLVGSARFDGCVRACGSGAGVRALLWTRARSTGRRTPTSPSGSDDVPPSLDVAHHEQPHPTPTPPFSPRLANPPRCRCRPRSASLVATSPAPGPACSRPAPGPSHQPASCCACRPWSC